MKTQAFFTLWLPIIHFENLKQNLQNSNQYVIYEVDKNNNWSWVKFQYRKSTIIIDSLGYCFIEGTKLTSDNEKIQNILEFIAQILDEETVTIITETLLNTKVGYNQKGFDLEKFLSNILVEINPKPKSIQLEYLNSTLHIDHQEVYTNKKIKFSLINDEPNLHTILNRNFQQLLNKSIYFTHGLEFDKGEIYDLSLINHAHEFVNNFDDLNSILMVNIQDINLDRYVFLQKIIQKVLQNTIEERTILHFLEITEKLYLSQIVNKISITNDRLKQLNSYLLEDVDQDTIKQSKNTKEIEDEWNIEVFIQNLLQTTPKFQILESKLKEAYYIKVGNTTTDTHVEQNEMIRSTLFYQQWKSSIKYFIYTANNAKESLNLYHQNKTLKELEDISYNANYQADIEDIRELQKRKDISLDHHSKMIFLALAVITLAGEAQLFSLDSFFYIGDNASPNFITTAFCNFGELVLNGTFYYFIVYFLFFKLIPQKKVHHVKSNKFFLNFFKKEVKKSPNKNINIYKFEDSDYDKHEHRSSRNLYNFNQSTGKYQKVFLSYNDTLSAYILVTKLKALLLKKSLNRQCFTFNIFPALLKNPPTLENYNQYTYRENYRISRNDKVTTKLMFRYKINDIKLIKLLEFIEEDDFLIYFKKYLESKSLEEDSSFIGIDESLKILRSVDQELFNEIELTFYIVYSFILKLNDIQKNIYDYSVTKDQFRVHYHINKLDYISLEDLKKKQEAIAQLIYIYFLARLKKLN